MPRVTAHRWDLRTRVMGTVVVGEKTQLWLWENKCGPGVEKEDWGGHRLLGGVVWIVQAAGRVGGHLRVHHSEHSFR